MTHCDDAMAERIAEFKSDPQKIEVANKFVDEVIEKARDEATKKIKEKKRLEGIATESGSERRRAPWHSRARGFFSRIVAICFCNSETKV